jgi:hypothetical protein
MQEYKPGPDIGIVIFTIVAGLFFGFLMGWASNENGDYNLVCIFITIFLMVALKRARDMYVANIVNRSELAREHRKEEEALISKQLKLVKEQVTLQIEHPFTSENFAQDAQNLLLDIIAKARKQKQKVVSGSLLVTELLKSIR